jgi:hypothetical protein
VLAQRLQAKINQVLHHLTDFAVPWTSNLAEQALRHVKIHLKISGCFRTRAFHHLDIGGAPITDWAHYETADYIGGHGVDDSLTLPYPSLFLTVRP